MCVVRLTKEVSLGERGRSVSAEENKDLIRRWIEEVEKGNLDVIDEVLDPNFTDHTLLSGQQPDRGNYKKGLSEDHRAFSNLSISIEDQIAEGDKVVTRYRWRGTHSKGKFRGKAPHNQEIEAEAIVIHRVVGGKVTDEWSAGDNPG